jgi:hypothetical protein
MPIKKTKMSTFKYYRKLLIIFLFPVVSCSTVIELLRYNFSNSLGKISLKNLIQSVKLKLMPLYLQLKPAKSEFKLCSKCMRSHEDLELNEQMMIECESTRCDAIYCLDCFYELNNVCKLCKMRISEKEDNDEASSDESFESNSSINGSSDSDVFEDFLESGNLSSSLRSSNRLSNTLTLDRIFKVIIC